MKAFVLVSKQNQGRPKRLFPPEGVEINNEKSFTFMHDAAKRKLEDKH